MLWIAVIIIYMLIGFFYGISILSRDAIGKSALAISHPIVFLFFMVVFWPFPYIMYTNYNYRRRKRLPRTIRRVSHRNVCNFLNRHQISSLTRQELEWCEDCLQELIDRHPDRRGILAATIRGPSRNEQIQRQALRLIELIHDELKKMST